MKNRINKLIDFIFTIVMASVTFWKNIICGGILFGLDVAIYNTIIVLQISNSEWCPKFKSNIISKVISLLFFSYIAALLILILNSQVIIKNFIGTLFVVLSLQILILFVVEVYYIMDNDNEKFKKLYNSIKRLVLNLSETSLIVSLLILTILTIYLNLIFGVFIMPGLSFYVYLHVFRKNKGENND
ncbi:hypothetical protein IU403_02365 [Aerococcaceae bacterium zg-BR22]|uniref:hypothetical protein n=1 Tax=Aerococcaceae bacterium zg-1292 TaxID=2774330 RepID=UPI0040639F32|nr:hypothetical protein [Aerococcaceae bacterium zg-BR22]